MAFLIKEREVSILEELTVLNKSVSHMEDESHAATSPEKDNPAPH